MKAVPNQLYYTLTKKEYGKTNWQKVIIWNLKKKKKKKGKANIEGLGKS